MVLRDEAIAENERRRDHGTNTKDMHKIWDSHLESTIEQARNQVYPLTGG
jgi:hypothetical protein